jgi:hypothetical protein
METDSKKSDPFTEAVIDPYKYEPITADVKLKTMSINRGGIELEEDHSLKKTPVIPKVSVLYFTDPGWVKCKHDGYIAVAIVLVLGGLSAALVQHFLYTIGSPMVMFTLSALAIGIGLTFFVLSYWLLAREPYAMAIDARSQTIVFSYTQYLCRQSVDKEFPFSEIEEWKTPSVTQRFSTKKRTLIYDTNHQDRYRFEIQLRNGDEIAIVLPMKPEGDEFAGRLTSLHVLDDNIGEYRASSEKAVRRNAELIHDLIDD